jgi:hypothetical protein
MGVDDEQVHRVGANVEYAESHAANGIGGSASA